MADNKTVEQVVGEHTIQLSFIVGALSEIKEAIKEISQTNSDIKVIMERQANHEDNNESEHRFIHARIDKIEETCVNIVDTHKIKCNLVEPKAEKGEMAFKILSWAGVIIGGAMILDFLSKWLGIGK